MPPNTQLICALTEQKYTTPPRASTGNRNEPVLRRFRKLQRRAGAPHNNDDDADAFNLRSFAFICGLVSTRLLTDDTDWKDLHGYEIRANPCHPRNPCSTSASLFVDAPYSKDSDRINRMDRINPSTNPVHPVQFGSSFSAAPDINCYGFIKVRASQKSSPQSHHIPPTFSSKHSPLLSERRLNAARKTKYAFLQLFNSKIDKTGDNENI